MSTYSRRIQARIDRIRVGGVMRVLDLFAGCGGFSLGFKRAGFDIIGGIEIDPVRASTFLRNLRPDLALKEPAVDIVTADPSLVLRNFAVRNWKSAVDGLIGGPPCQAYARIGRAKLRDLRGSAQAFLDDPRGELYEHYLDYVETLAPLFIVMENVPDILSIGGRNIAEDIACHLEHLGYEVRYTLLNAAGYGVPQFRERLFLCGVHQMVGVTPDFPVPTRRVRFPEGFRGTCAAARKAGGQGSPLHLAGLPSYGDARRRPPVASEEALSDLPRVGVRLRQQGKGRRFLDDSLPYHTPPVTAYQRLMRSWSGFRTSTEVTANESRYLPRDFELFALMAEGDEYPQLHALAERRFEVELRRRQALGALTAGEVADLRAGMVPPYDATKFPNKWRKMERAAPSRTLMAHLSHDSYTHIHYDSSEARTITVREAARLQSFPDGYRFCGAMNSALGQIGNAVPPLMAEAIGIHLRGRILTALASGPVDCAAKQTRRSTEQLSLLPT